MQSKNRILKEEIFLFSRLPRVAMKGRKSSECRMEKKNFELSYSIWRGLLPRGGKHIVHCRRKSRAGGNWCCVCYFVEHIINIISIISWSSLLLFYYWKSFVFIFFTFPSAGSAVFSIFHSFFRNHKNVRLAFHSGIHFVKATALIEPRKKRKFVARATFLCHFKKSCCASFLPLASWLTPSHPHKGTSLTV